MSYRPQFSPFPIFNATTGQDMSSDITGLVTITQKLSLISYAFSWSGTSPDGSISIEASNDYSLNPDGSVNNAGTWNPLTLVYNGATTTTIPVTGNTGKGFVDIVLTGAYALRPLYTAVSGTGTLDGVINAKVS